MLRTRVRVLQYQCPPHTHTHTLAEAHTSSVWDWVSVFRALNRSCSKTGTVEASRTWIVVPNRDDITLSVLGFRGLWLGV